VAIQKLTTGLLAHCAEALWAANADPITDAIALDGAADSGST
jgi:alcohol dehydrogenase class IV